MTERTFAPSPKEMAAFEGLFRLAATRKDFSNIKVQEIATAAGIGKGTLYEYFSSKEEILCRAILYALERTIGWFEEQMEQRASLFQTMDRFLDRLESEQPLPVSIVTACNAIVSAEQRKDFQEQNQEHIEWIFQRMKQCEKQFFEAARRNGEIDPALDDSFCEYVIVSALCGIAGKNVCAHQQGKKLEWKCVQQLIFRALRP